MKQTAVDWFYQRILAKDIKEVYKQAKQMEKEQIEEAFIKGEENIDQYGCYENPNLSEQYYQETYG